MRNANAFTLLEVVVAGGLLAIGVLSVAMLQVQALQIQRRVAVVRQLVAVAEAELYRSLALTEPASGVCAGSGTPEVVHCVVETEPCNMSTAALCGGPAVGGATRVTVLVEREGQEFELSAIHARFGG